eukprot:4489811-Pleurochrysis_carterae.AAC.1
MPDGSWTSNGTAAYPPDMNYLIAKAIASLRPSDQHLRHTPLADESNKLPIPIAVATPLPSSQPPPAPFERPNASTDAVVPPDIDAVMPPGTMHDDQPNDSRQFQRGLGSFSLRSSALLVTRRHRPFDVISDRIRGHGCALAA